MTEPRTEAGRRLLERLTTPPYVALAHPEEAILAIEAEAVEAALTVERIAEALQIGWPGSRTRRQTYRALAAALRVALLAPSNKAPND